MTTAWLLLVVLKGTVQDPVYFKSLDDCLVAQQKVKSQNFHTMVGDNYWIKAVCVPKQVKEKEITNE